MLFHRFILGNLVTNCYVIADEKTKNAVLFDAPAQGEKILDYLEKNNLTLKYVFLTHAHFDHIPALKEVTEKTGAKIFLHKEEEKYLNNPSLNLVKDTEETLEEISEYSCLNDGDEICVDEISIKILHTPGHTTGSSCYLLGEDTLISGDTLFSGSIGRTDFPLGSFEDEIRSIKEKLMVLDDEVKVCPGHGFSTTIGKQRKENPFLI